MNSPEVGEPAGTEEPLQVMVPVPPASGEETIIDSHIRDSNGHCNLQGGEAKEGCSLDAVIAPETGGLLASSELLIIRRIISHGITGLQ